MASDAIGMVETKGLVSAIEAADAGLKSANVKFESLIKPGSGYAAVSFSGDVAAVKAAVDAAAEAAGRIGQVISVNVIARPHDDVAKV